MRRRSAPPAGTPAPGIDFAWRVHAALQDWTRSVDQKASIILALSAAIATIAGREVFDANGGLRDTSSTKLWLVRIMAISFAASALLASSVVLPRLRRSAARREAHRGLIYFGHLRHRTAADIEQHLRRLDDDETLAQLARQLEATAAVAWRKHARLQAATIALMLATTSFATARLFL